MSTLCFTGHRPDKLNGYDPKNNKNLLWALREEVVGYIEDFKVNTFISGMALGIDMWSARIVLKLKEIYPHINLVCAVPCLNHTSKWPEQSRKEWQYIVDRCDKFIVITEELYHPYLMQVRNEWMVNNSDYVLAVHDGSEGGTGNCVDYANKKKKNVLVLNPNDYK